MKGKPVEELIYEYMFPKPRHTDPTDFQHFLSRSLIPEMRREVHAYYNHIDTAEAKYPGLDYCRRIHRIRLSRWPWHRRLFRAFDGLRLTDHEISTLTKWEGTRWAKERYEREQGVTIRDSADDAIADYVEPADRPYQPLRARVDTPSVVSDDALDEVDDATLEDDDDDDDDDEDENDDDLEEVDDAESDDAMESVGPTLNERLREQVARREAGDSSAVLDEEWEQWLKNALEMGGFPDVAQAIFQGGWVNSESLLPALSVFPPGMLSAARAGRWRDVPDILAPTLRRALYPEEEAQGQSQQPRRSADHDDDAWGRPPAEEPRLGVQEIYRRYSDLRLSRRSGSLQGTAEARGA